MGRATATSRAPRGHVAPSARLAFLEQLLACEDAAACAKASLDWLHKNAGVDRAVCALFEGASRKLVPIAARGVSLARSSALSRSFEDKDQALARATSRTRPVHFGQNGRSARGASPFGNTPYAAYALPLYATEREFGDRVGLLLVAADRGASKRAAEEIAWAADIVGSRILRLRSLDRVGEAELRLSAERSLVFGLLNAVPDPVLLTDTEGRLILANARAEALFASTENESEGRRRAVALNNMLFSAGLSQQAMTASEALRRELPLVDPVDGSDLLFELLSAATEIEGGTGVVSVLRNVTDLRRVAEELEENYKKLRAAETNVRAERDRLDLIIDSVADPILVTDPTGSIVLMNTPAERLFVAEAGRGGRPPGHAGAAPSEKAQRVRANDAHFSSFVSNLFFGAEGRRWSGEIGLVEPETGVPLPVEAFAGTVMSEHGEVTAVVTILHDRAEAVERARLYEQLKRVSEVLEEKVREATTELVQQNEKLRRQHVELEQASALKTQFLANMSHEFRTPLNAILGFTSILLQGVVGPLTPRHAKSLSRVDSNARHLLSIINDILDISRIEAGKMPVTLTVFDVVALVHEVIGELDPLIVRSKLTVKVHADRRKEKLRKLARVRSDRSKVKQILVNLLTNALKFTPHGFVTTTVDCEARERFRIDVTDTGVGISETDRARVFEDFRQVDNSPTRQYGGAGLGLAICRRLARVLGGDIALASVPGEGSTFTLALPLRMKK